MVRGNARLRCIEINDMDPLGAGFLESPSLLERVVVIYRDLVVVTLKKSYSLPS